MKLRYISWIPAVFIMIIIFCFSSKPADNSNESSLGVTNEIVTIFENITNTHYQEVERANIVLFLNNIVRKGAHFCEYAVLACAFAFHFAVCKRRGKLLFLLPIAFSALYAMTDEFHQLFIPGRAGMIRDVLLDTSGAATGSLLFSLIVIVIAKKVKRHQKLLLS